MMIDRNLAIVVLGLVFWVSTSFLPVTPEKVADQSLPNIIFIMADQMRGDALSCLGNPNARTPHLDSLAEAGVLFENFFVNNPVCTPSRISFFTGQRPHQHGVLTNLHQSGTLNTDDQPATLEGTLLGYLKAKGYTLGWVGKNHTFGKSAMQALDQASIRDREPFRAYSEFVPPHWHSDFFWPEKTSHATINTQEAIDFINKAEEGRPFFLHVSYFDPHPPYMAPARYASRFSAPEMQLPPFIPPRNLSDRLEAYYKLLHLDELTQEDLQETLRYYYASVAYGVDLQVGSLLKTLAEKGISDNTIIVFTADHGDFMGHYGMVRKGMFLYDALLHVPFIMYAPGQMTAGTRTSVMAEGVDLFPTLVDLTGGEAIKELPGRSLKPFLSGKTEADDHLVFASAAYSDLGPEPEPWDDPESDRALHNRVYKRAANADQRTAMVRNHDWKLILNESAPPELYRLAGTIGEQQNVAHDPQHAKVLRTLTQAIEDEWPWWKKHTE